MLMKLIKSEDELEELVKESIMIIVYFTGNTCGACEIIKSRIQSILTKFNKIISAEVNGEENINIAAKYGVFSLPIMLLYIDGKETLRVGRNVDFLDLQNQISRYYNMIYIN